MESGIFQIPSDLVVKCQSIDIVDVIVRVGVTTTHRGATGNQGVSGPHPLRRSVYHEIRGNVRFVIRTPVLHAIGCFVFWMAIGSFVGLGHVGHRWMS